MSHVYLFSHVGLCVFPYLLNYITSLYWKLSENYKHGCRNDQPICKNKGRNESNELSSNNLRFFQNNLGLVFHTTYSCIFHPCDLLLLFPLPHFQSPPRGMCCYTAITSRNFGLKSEGDQAKLLTWCTYKAVGGPSSHSKKWGSGHPSPLKLRLCILEYGTRCRSRGSSFIQLFNVNQTSEIHS